MGLKSSKERTEVPESSLIGFELNRAFYFWLILIITVLALLENVLVIRAVIYRKHRFLQKTCIISLAVSDIITVSLFALSNLDLLRKPLMTWIYGEFLCHFMPIGQVLTNLTSSISLLVIALDRYHNVIHALSKKWNPSVWKCLSGTAAIWIVCAGIAYPVATFYVYIPILVNGDETAMCTGVPLTKETIFLYYICMNCLFFLPILLMFFWFYYNIAILIWRHRKPPGAPSNPSEVTETSATSTTTSKPLSTKKRNVQMERKIRSFKIVVVLVIAFVGCRLPYWFLMLYQQVNVVDRTIIWHLRFFTIAIYMFNCALNPLLYTFLNFTLSLCKKISESCCCWCSSSDFEDFEKGNHMAEEIVRVEKKDGVDLNKVQFIDAAPNQREVY